MNVKPDAFPHGTLREQCDTPQIAEGLPLYATKRTPSPLIQTLRFSESWASVDSVPHTDPTAENYTNFISSIETLSQLREHSLHGSEERRALDDLVKDEEESPDHPGDTVDAMCAEMNDDDSSPCAEDESPPNSREADDPTSAHLTGSENSPGAENSSGTNRRRLEDEALYAEDNASETLSQQKDADCADATEALLVEEDPGNNSAGAQDSSAAHRRRLEDEALYAEDNASETLSQQKDADCADATEALLAEEGPGNNSAGAQDSSAANRRDGADALCGEQNGSHNSRGAKGTSAVSRRLGGGALYAEDNASETVSEQRDPHRGEEPTALHGEQNDSHDSRTDKDASAANRRDGADALCGEQNGSHDSRTDKDASAANRRDGADALCGEQNGMDVVPVEKMASDTDSRGEGSRNSRLSKYRSPIHRYDAVGNGEEMDAKEVPHCQQQAQPHQDLRGGRESDVEPLQRTLSQSLGSAVQRSVGSRLGGRSSERGGSGAEAVAMPTALATEEPEGGSHRSRRLSKSRDPVRSDSVSAASVAPPVKPSAGVLQRLPPFPCSSITPCFKQGNGLLFRMINGETGQWAYYNDTTEYMMHIHFFAGPKSCLMALGATRMLEPDDTTRYFEGEVWVAPRSLQLLFAGTVNGYDVKYKAIPLRRVR